MSARATFAPGYTHDTGDRPADTMVLPFPEMGANHEAECIPATGSVCCVDVETNTGIVALCVGALGIYAPCDPTILRNMSAAYSAMADEIERSA